MRWTRKPFDIGFERIVLLSQQAAQCHSTGCMSRAFQFSAQMTQTAARPFVLTHGVATCLSFYQLPQGTAYLRVFFSTASRPPPSIRTRCVGRSSSKASSSRRPRGLYIHARYLGQESVTAVADLLGLQSSVPAALLLIQTAQKQIHLSVQLLEGACP